MIETIQTFGLPILEIFFIAFLLYKTLTLIQGTPAIIVAKWLGLFLLASILAKLAGLHAVAWLLDKFWIWGVILLAIFFQRDFSRIIEVLGTKNKLFKAITKVDTRYITEIVAAVERIANRKFRAVIAIEREYKLDYLIDSGIRLDAEISHELLLAIFSPNSPLQDGAVVICNRRLASAGVPLTPPPEVKGQDSQSEQDSDAAASFGIRYRSAIRLTEETDAIVVIVLAEEGIVSVVMDGNITQDINAETLGQMLTAFLIS